MWFYLAYTDLVYNPIRYIKGLNFYEKLLQSVHLKYFVKKNFKDNEISGACLLL